MQTTTKYQAGLRRRYWGYQAAYFSDRQKFFDRPYIPPGKRPPVFLAHEAWQNVLMDPNADRQTVDRLLAYIPKWARHTWFRSMNSSQALAQSLFGNLAIYGYLPCLTELQADEGDPLFGDAQVSAENFEMEYKVNYLGEPRPTSLDGYISGDYRVAIECKFTETEIGTCSRPRLRPGDAKYELEHCDGNYTRAVGHQERCPLTHNGIQYWHSVPSLFNWSSDTDLVPCPLNRNYQLVRNILAIGVNADGKVSCEDGHVVLIYDERNPAFQGSGKSLQSYRKTRNTLRKPSMLRKCSWQRIVQHIRDKGVMTWLTEQLALKYGL